MADLISSREAAEILGCSLAKVKRDAKRGDLTYVHKGEGTAGYLFDKTAIARIARKAQRLAAHREAS